MLLKRYTTRNGEFARRLQAAEHESTWPQTPTIHGLCISGSKPRVGTYVGSRQRGTRYKSHNRLQNSPYFCVFKYARAVKQKVWNALSISLLILRKKPTVLQSRAIMTPTYNYITSQATEEYLTGSCKHIRPRDSWCLKFIHTSFIRLF